MKMTSADICAIIKTCADSGVTFLCLGELTVEFNNHRSEPPIQDEEVNPMLQEVVSENEIERDEIALRDDQLAHMEIEDPVAYERELLKGDLIDSKELGDEPDEGHSGAQ